MKYSVLISWVVLAIMISSVMSECLGRQKACNNSRQCCSRYCRNGQCINFGDSPDDEGATNPCAGKPCKPDEICVLDQVTCVRFPCRPIRACYKK